MANTIRLKRSSVAGKVPTLSDLSLGELGLNSADAKLYTRRSVGGVDTIAEIGASGVASPIVQPAYVISENVTLGTSRHGLSLTSVEVASGYSVEVPSGATWTIAVI